jgi:hypothetical protein
MGAELYHAVTQTKRQRWFFGVSAKPPFSALQTLRKIILICNLLLENPKLILDLKSYVFAHAITVVALNYTARI